MKKTTFNVNINKLLETTKLGLILKLLFAYIAICGLFLFPAFIAEEAIQVAIWATWPAQDTQSWSLVLTGCDLIRNINRGMKTINYSVGWIQPLAFLSYRSFGRATDYYVRTLEHKVFAYAPEIFAGRQIEFIFVPDEIVSDREGTRLINNGIHVITDTIPGSRKVVVSGRVEMRGGTVIIMADKVAEIK